MSSLCLQLFFRKRLSGTQKPWKLQKMGAGGADQELQVKVQLWCAPYNLLIASPYRSGSLKTYLLATWHDSKLQRQIPRDMKIPRAKHVCLTMSYHRKVPSQVARCCMIVIPYCAVAFLLRKFKAHPFCLCSTCGVQYMLYNTAYSLKAVFWVHASIKLHLIVKLAQALLLFHKLHAIGTCACSNVFGLPIEYCHCIVQLLRYVYNTKAALPTAQWFLPRVFSN